MKEEDIRKAITIKRLVKYFFDEIKYRMKLPCLKANAREMSTKYIFLNLFRKIVNLPFNKQYEIEEQLALDVGGKIVVPDAVLIRRDDHQKCSIIGLIEAKAENVNLEYERRRLFLHSSKSNIIFWQPGEIIIDQDSKLTKIKSEEIFKSDNDFNLPKVKAKVEEFIDLIMKFYQYSDALFEFNEANERYSSVKTTK